MHAPPWKKAKVEPTATSSNDDADTIRKIRLLYHGRVGSIKKAHAAFSRMTPVDYYEYPRGVFYKQNPLDDRKLQEAVKRRDVPVVERLLKSGVNPARTPALLHDAIGNARLTQLLLAAGARTEHRNGRGMTPLMVASGFSRLTSDAKQRKTIEMLLKAKARVGTRNHLGMTALHHAVRSYDAKKVAMLVEAGANPHLRNRRGVGYTAYDHAAAHEVDQDVLSALDETRHAPPVNFGTRKPVAKTHKALREEARAWTGDIYSFIRKIRSQSTPGIDPVNAQDARATNHALATMMHSKIALRAPETPPGVDVQYVSGLYRGISGPASTALMQDGYLDDPSWVATSLDYGVAKRFADEQGLLLHFEFREIQPGTPWIWFAKDEGCHGRKRCERGTLYSRAQVHESEVLLPPGRITLLGDSGIHGIGLATFTPHPSFMKTR